MQIFTMPLAFFGCLLCFCCKKRRQFHNPEYFTMWVALAGQLLNSFRFTSRFFDPYCRAQYICGRTDTMSLVSIDLEDVFVHNKRRSSACSAIVTFN